MAGFVVSDSLHPGYEIEIKVIYRDAKGKLHYFAPEAEELCKALTTVYGRAFQEIVNRLGEPMMVRELTEG